jgi:hypothetical protein
VDWASELPKVEVAAFSVWDVKLPNCDLERPLLPPLREIDTMTKNIFFVSEVEVS